jgi:hypothetical protein
VLKVKDGWQCTSTPIYGQTRRIAATSSNGPCGSLCHSKECLTNIRHKTHCTQFHCLMSITCFSDSCWNNSLYNSKMNIMQHASTYDTTRHDTTHRHGNLDMKPMISKTAETIFLCMANKAAMCISFNRKTQFVWSGAACTEQSLPYQLRVPVPNTLLHGYQSLHSADKITCLYDVPHTTAIAIHTVLYYFVLECCPSEKCSSQAPTVCKMKSDSDWRK